MSGQRWIVGALLAGLACSLSASVHAMDFMVDPIPGAGFVEVDAGPLPQILGAPVGSPLELNDVFNDMKHIELRDGASSTFEFGVGGFIPGDYNGDGLVDVADAATWAGTYGSTTEFVADGNQNGVVDQGDYDILYENFGMSGLLTAETDGIAAGEAASVVSFIYDPNSGEVTLDPNNSPESFVAFKLITTGAFNDGVANAPFQRFVTDPNSVLPDGDTFVELATEIGQIDINGRGLPDDGFNLGPILPIGLSLGDLQTQLSSSHLFVRPGEQANFEFVAVPEPAMLMSAVVVGGVILLIRSRISGNAVRAN